MTHELDEKARDAATRLLCEADGFMAYERYRGRAPDGVPVKADDIRTVAAAYLSAKSEPVAVRALNADEIADALDCFWNAGIGEAHNQQDSTAMATVSAIAVGLAAISTRLKEHAALASEPANG